MELKLMSDTELAKRMVNYIEGLEFLMNDYSQYTSDSCRLLYRANQIREMYKILKRQIREDADYLAKSRNSTGSQLYMIYFMPSIKEAAAFGFTAPVNARVNYEMYSAIEEAHYKLTKYLSLEKWKEVSLR